MFWVTFPLVYFTDGFNSLISFSICPTFGLFWSYLIKMLSVYLEKPVI
jgi:hypothetical protein